MLKYKYWLYKINGFSSFDCRFIDLVSADSTVQYLSSVTDFFVYLYK